MALTSGDLGTIIAWPLRFIPQGKPSIVTTNNSTVRATPVCVMSAEFVDVSTIDDDRFVVAVAGVASASTASLTLANTTSTIPRALTVTVTHATSIVAQTFALTGTDQYGRTITETLTITATGTSKTATSLQAFKTLTAATQTAAADASANTIILGDSKVLGLPFKCAVATVLGDLQDGAAVTDGTLVIASTTAGADLRGTYTPNGTPNGALDFKVFYICEDPVNVVA
jgi:hypothetical protein